MGGICSKDLKNFNRPSSTHLQRKISLTTENDQVSKSKSAITVDNSARQNSRNKWNISIKHLNLKCDWDIK